jgi:hypothetical protein
VHENILRSQPAVRLLDDVVDAMITTCPALEPRKHGRFTRQDVTADPSDDVLPRLRQRCPPTTARP